jgi:hypothetical protein
MAETADANLAIVVSHARLPVFERLKRAGGAILA